MFYQQLDLKLRNPHLSLAMDEAIAYLLATKNHSCAIRFWANPSAVVLGRTCSIDKNVPASLIDKFTITSKRKIDASIPHVCRRASGGGTVVHGCGNINFSLFFSLKKFPHLYSVADSYRFILSLIKKSLTVQSYTCDSAGMSDIILRDEDGTERKISGNAQFRKYGVLIHHGTLITRPQIIETANKYLLHPQSEPDYRRGRDHKNFLASLNETFDLPSFYGCIASEMKSRLNLDSPSPFTREEKQELYRIARKLVDRVYKTREWILNGKALHHPYTFLVNTDESE